MGHKIRETEKTYLCPECGRELRKGESCLVCNRKARAEAMLVDDSYNRNRLFKV